MPEIWTPESARVGYFCRLCGKPYGKGEMAEWEAHVVRCSDDRAQEHADAAAERAEFNAPVDPEWEAYNSALRNAGIDPDVQFSRNRRSGIRRAGES